MMNKNSRYTEQQDQNPTSLGLQIPTFAVYTFLMLCKTDVVFLFSIFLLVHSVSSYIHTMRILHRCVMMYNISRFLV